jgi:phosphatidylglycerol:prolipoprotein diacylglycerol transferase
MLPVLQIGPLAIQLPGLLLVAGVWLAYLILEREARRKELPVRELGNLLFYALVAGIVGARLGYALQFIDIYLADPIGLVSLNPGTLSLREGLLSALLVALVYGNRKALPFWRTLDAFTPSLAFFAISLGLAHLASGDAFGAPTDLPWAIDLWGARRHPSQLYEIIQAGVIFFLILRLRGVCSLDGCLFLVNISLVSASSLFLGAFRGDSVILFAMFRQEQVLALLALLAALLGLHILARHAVAEPGA